MSVQSVSILPRGVSAVPRQNCGCRGPFVHIDYYWLGQPRNVAGLGRLLLFGAHKMDDGTERNAYRAAAWGLPGRPAPALDAAACGPPAERKEMHDHLAAPRIHHPYQNAWCRLGLLASVGKIYERKRIAGVL
ncbi:unnamed protein product [Parnassius apollo]|uniref:(apollo) hypothetical protein n=1 Tax=Parnassius apollo TaxID=110799 RepID=A0A8S3WY77_PARAO|nr:unnamed protein product [Parnassius apollo]